MCEERQRTHFFLAGFLRAEASFGAAEEDEEAAALGGTLVDTEVDFADADVEFVEDGVAAAGPSAALVPEDMAGFCKEVRLKLNFVQFVFELHTLWASFSLLNPCLGHYMMTIKQVM